MHLGRTRHVTACAAGFGSVEHLDLAVGEFVHDRGKQRLLPQAAAV
jgi:hypothetical protein